MTTTQIKFGGSSVSGRFRDSERCSCTGAWGASIAGRVVWLCKAGARVWAGVSTGRRLNVLPWGPVVDKAMFFATRELDCYTCTCLKLHF